MKYLSIFTVILLLISGMATFGISEQSQTDDFYSVDFSQMQIQTKTIQENQFSQIKLDEPTALIHQAGKPMLPRKITTIELPFGTRIKDIDCDISTVQETTITHPILPAPKPMVLDGSSQKEVYECNPEIYESDALYPNDWFRYHTGAGLNKENEHTLFLTIELYPIRYNPSENTIFSVESIDVSISYELPDEKEQTTTDEFDMVIISPESFSDNLQPLIDHKNSYNVKTYLKTLEEIYSEYDGFDKAEQIKYFIKDAFDTQHITYVMLVGGMNTYFFGPSRDNANIGESKWHLPVRYTNIQEMGSVHDPGFISDMYYADLYDGEGNFSSWDKGAYTGESDGIYAKWNPFGRDKDVLDCIPEVYVGRLACRNNWEVKVMVDKIIEYETTTSMDSSWFNRMIGIGGDSHDDPLNLVEGEVLCDYVYDTYMTDFDPVKLYASHKESQPDFIPSPEAIVREVTNGASFLLFDGHGHPGSWNTHWPGEFNWADTPGGISCYDFPDFGNSGKYPITVIGGCHNSQFNISIVPTMLDKPYMWTHGAPFPECFGWWIVRKVDGGAIASMGNTGLGYGAVGNNGDLDGDGVDNPDTVESVGGYQEVMFFKAINEGVDILGEAWGLANTYYINTYPPMDDKTDCKTVTQWPLLGDPSLKIGGYS